MATTELTINGVDLRTLRFRLRETTGLADAPALEYPTARVIGAGGETRLSVAPAVRAREVRIMGAIYARSASEARSCRDSLLALLSAGELTVAPAHWPDRTLVGRLTGWSQLAYGRELKARAWSITATITCHQPYLVATSDTVVALSGTPAACALGTARSEPVIVADGPFTDLTITLEDADGDPAGTMALTGAVASGDSLTIDMAARTIMKTVGGVTSSALNMLGDDADFLALDPADSDYTGSAWPTLALTAASGTPTGTATYRKRWR